LDEIKRKIADSGEELLCGPEPCAIYCEKSRYKGTRGNGVAFLSKNKLVFEQDEKQVVLAPEDISGAKVTYRKYLRLYFEMDEWIDLQLLKKPRIWLEAIQQISPAKL
jgi:hypothetical protein